MTAKPAPNSIIIFSNGNIICFDSENRQILELQKDGWLEIWLKNLEAKGINPLDIENVFLEKKGQLQNIELFKTPEGDWNYRLIVVPKFNIGDKVTYIGDSPPEKGIVKSTSAKWVYVVYSCGEDWENYENYTSQSTRPDDLILGWE